MNYCPKCNLWTVMYFHPLKTAYCTNKGCGYNWEFETYSESERVLSELSQKKAKLRLFRRRHKGVEIKPEFSERVDVLARELHAVFVRSSIEAGVLDVFDVQSFEDISYNAKETLVALAIYIDKNFERKR